MIRENAADSRHHLSDQRGAIGCGPDGPKAGAIAVGSRSSCAMVQRDAIGTWEDEGGSITRDHLAAVERPERLERMDTSGSGTAPPELSLVEVDATLRSKRTVLGRGNPDPDHRQSVQALHPHAPGAAPHIYGLGRECSRCDRLETAVSELARALEFKEALLQEMHHRVKNTLQIAASSLSMQSHATCCAEAQAALRQAFDRLHVLAVVHEMLSLQATPGRTIAMPPLLRALASALEKSFSELSARVGLRVFAEEVSLGVDQAIPLALFANEAITNAYIHAFPDGASGEIVVDLCYTSEAVILEVSDTGVGMSSSGRKDGLGMNLIRGFASQLAATLSCTGVERAGGTVLNLWLPLDVRRYEDMSAMSG